MILYVYKGLDKDTKEFKDHTFSCYRVSDRGEEKICVMKDMIEGNEQIFEHHYVDGNVEKTYFSLTSELSKQLRKGLTLFQGANAHFVLDENNQCIGRVFLKSNKLKKHLILTYNSEIFQYKNNEYESCEIGFRRDGQYYVVYENGVNIAVIENVYYLSSNLCYKIYSTKEAPELLHLAATYFLDRIYSPRKHPSDVGSLWTPYKEIREKFNPEFINTVKMMDGIID